MRKKYFSNLLPSIFFMKAVLFSSLSITAQTIQIDSLKQLCLLEPDSKLKIDHYNAISSDLIDLGIYEEAQSYGQKALSLATRLNSQNGQYVAHINLGNAFADLGQSEEALAEYKKALKIAEEGKDLKAQAECLNNIGLVFHNTARYEDAMSSFTKSLEFRKEIQYDGGIIDSYTNIGNVFTLTGKYPEAMSSYLECLKLSEKNNDIEGILNSYNNISVVLLNQGKSQDALIYLEQAKVIANSFSDNQTLANIYNNIGFAYYIQQEMPKALENFKASLKRREIVSDLYGLAVSYNNIGAIHEQENELDSALIYYGKAKNVQIKLDDQRTASAIILNMAILETKRNNYAIARTLLDEGLSVAQNHNIKDLIRDIHLQYAMVDSLEGDWEDAYKHARLYSSYKEGLFNETINEQVESLKIQYETEKKEKENVQLKLENENQSNRNLLLFKQNEITNLRLRAEQDQHLISQNLTRQQKDSIQYLEGQRKIQEALSEQEHTLRITEAQLHEEAIQKKNLILLIIGLLGVLTGIIIYLADRVKKRKVHVALKEVEEKALRAQLKPHFVFNALASIQKYVRDNPTMAENFLSKFSHFTQEVLVNSEKKFITLSEELAMLGKYIDLHSLRLKQPIEYSFSIDPGIDPEDILVPPAILQPLIENSINHNFASKQGRGTISLTCEMDGRLLKCSIIDTCEGQASKLEAQESRLKDRKSFGLDIVRDRLALWSKGKSIKGFLELMPQKDGMKVILGIPL